MCNTFCTGVLVQDVKCKQQSQNFWIVPSLQLLKCARTWQALKFFTQSVALLQVHKSKVSDTLTYIHAQLIPQIMQYKRCKFYYVCGMVLLNFCAQNNEHRKSAIYNGVCVSSREGILQLLVHFNKGIFTGVLLHVLTV